MARILIAENNETVRRYLVAALKKGGHRIDVAKSALEAWRAIGGMGDDTYDAFLLDVAMPGIDGFVLAQKAIGENSAMQIVFLTGFAAVAMDARTPSTAPAPFTSRPFHLKGIARRLGALMHGGACDTTAEQTGGTVIYADFTTHKTERRVEA